MAKIQMEKHQPILQPVIGGNLQTRYGIKGTKFALTVDVGHLLPTKQSFRLEYPSCTYVSLHDISSSLSTF